MSRFTDQDYLKSEQYKDASNLDARVLIHERFSTNPYGWFQWVFDRLLKLPETAKILELGCGQGLLWKENINRIPKGWTITLSDLSPGMLDAAWRNLIVLGRAFQFMEIDAQEIPFAEQTFDAVIANFMLYHVPDRPQAIREIERVLKPGGYLFAATVGENHMNEMMQWLGQVHVGNIWQSFANPFTLENGAEQLQPFFSNLSLARYEDSLNVTEVEPVMAYLRSSMRASELSEDELLKVQANLESKLKEEGRIFIAKDSGLFEAIK
jgi:ubiquinone/menaquinone biosynthesis C-methylase UbiE